jgi:hypothetical protein
MESGTVVLKRLAVLVILCTCLALAADPIATATGGPNLQINGKTAATAGAPNWPLAIGDELLTGAVPAVVSFPDGARLTLAAGTKIVVQVCDRCVAQLFQGSIEYHKSASSKLEVCALGHHVKPAAGSDGSIAVVNLEKVVVKVADKGQVASGGTCPCRTGAPWGKAGMSADKKALLILVPAAAAATGAAVAVTSGTPASTP